MTNPMQENVQKATESAFQMQQEAFKRFANFWPGAGADQPPWMERIRQFQKEWAELAGEQMKRQGETFEAQFQAGMRNIEAAFKLAEAKNPEEFRAKSVELWNKNVDTFRQTAETQFKEFQTTLEKWARLMTKGASAPG